MRRLFRNFGLDYKKSKRRLKSSTSPSPIKAVSYKKGRSPMWAASQDSTHQLSKLREAVRKRQPQAEVHRVKIVQDGVPSSTVAWS